MQIIIILLICIFVYIPSILILSTIKGKKPYKVKEDILFIEKHIFNFLILSLYILLYLYELLKDEEEDEKKEEKSKDEHILIYLCKIKIICFNIYIILHFSYNFFISIENYITYTHPNYYFNSLFNKRKNNILYEFLIIIFATIFSLLYLDINFNKDLNIYFKININFDKNILLIILSNDYDFDNNYKDINENNPFIILNALNLIYVLILNIITFFLYIVLKYKIKKIIFKTREKLFRIFTKKIILTFLYIAFILFNIFLFYTYKFNPTHKKIKLISKINSWLFIFIYILDSLFELSTFSTSKFAQYKLKYTIVDSIGSLFNRNNAEQNASNSLLDSMIRETSNNNGRYDSSDDEDDDNSLVMPLNNNDIELVLIYRNNIFIEDYFFYYYDYIINVTLSSLYKIYRTKNFSPVVLNNNQLNKELNISESAIFDGDKNIKNNLSNNPSFKKIDTGGSDELTYESTGNNDEYIFIKNSIRNDFMNADEIFTNTINDFSCDNITVKIKSYFTSKCISNLFDKNITSKIFNNSLKSHLNKNERNNSKINKNNISSDNNNFDLPYHSILSCNAKEEYFLNLKNMSIKSYDKQLTLDIFESNNDDISLDKNNSNKQLAIMIDKYFKYIEKVGVSGTFIPILLGIFKVKINSFKTMLIYISCNSLIENTPLNNYSYWQLIRFSFNEKKRIASSKYRHNILIKDDLIFDRKYAISSIDGGNNNYSNKIEIKNFSSFKETLKQDLNFLNKCGANDIKLLMLYFEYQNIKKSQNSETKNKKRENTKGEITLNSVTMPIFKEEDQSKDNIYIRDFSKKDDTEVATIPTIPLSTPDLINDKKSPDISNRFSVLNSNLNIENKKNIDNENNKNQIINSQNNNLNENLVIEFNKSEAKKDNYLKNSNNSMQQSLYGSLINADFLEDVMISYDDVSGRDKNSLGIKNNDLLNYIEKIKINSFDGYYDSTNCMCLFSFENIFNYKSEGCCNYFNFNLLRRNILNNFINYIPREQNIINKSNKIE